MTRPTAARRGYDARWHPAIAAYKDIHPWCIGCWVIGVRRETEVVDHVVPHRGDPALFWCEANWQPSCAWHHGAIKPALERDWRSGKIPDAALRLDSAPAQRLTRMKYRPAIGADGYPIEGT